MEKYYQELKEIETKRMMKKFNQNFIIKTLQSIVIGLLAGILLIIMI